MKKFYLFLTLIIVTFSQNIYAQCSGYSKEIQKNKYIVRINIDKSESCSTGSYQLSIKTPTDKINKFTQERDGEIEKVWLEKLSTDEYFSIIVAIRSAGSGGYEKLHIYRQNKDGQYELQKLAELSYTGYQGHDDYKINHGIIVRSFPVYKDKDANCCPKGGRVSLNYDFDANRWVEK